MKYTCPFCYKKFSRDDIEFRCESFTSTACKEEDALLATYFGQPRMLANHVIPNRAWSEFLNKKEWWKVFSKTSRVFVVPDEVLCDRCKAPSRKKVCPHCHNELPTYFHKADSHIISVIGARGSGKTHYITVLINELLKKGYKLDISTIPQDVGEDRTQVTSRRYQEYYRRPLLEHGDELTKTSIAKDLSPWSIKLPVDKRASIKRRRCIWFFTTQQARTSMTHWNCKNSPITLPTLLG
ncbi:MAG: hypothetical protein IPN76_21990 [Saprospiraceae bacterium]|nr:hypothetical protein [Saprospiraceae bacterium]